MKKANPGRQPAETKGKRVRVWLANGSLARDSRADKPGWEADQSRWTITGDVADIAFYEVL